MKRFLFFGMLGLMVACSAGGGEDPPPPSNPPPGNPDPDGESPNTPPSVPVLIFPESDQLCLDSDLNLQWAEAVDAENDAVTYRIQISTNRSFTSVVEDLTLQETGIDVILNKGQDYYWRVSATDSKNETSGFSASRAFYVEGDAATNYVPFRPALIAPEEGAQRNPSGILLEWETADLDGDALIYDLYLGTDSDPPLFESGYTESSMMVDLESNRTYFWRVEASDGISKSIGATWSFKTN